MKVSNRLNDAVVDALGLHIVELIKRHPDPELSQAEIITACIVVITSTVQSIKCAGCRKLAARYIKKAMPRFITTALIEAARSPSHSDHVH
jgi:hypothetical protein